MSLLLGMLLLAGCDRQSPDAPQGNALGETEASAKPEAAGTLDIAQRGAAMPATVFADPQGKKVTLADFKGKPLLVNLWATWCGPCIKEMPSLDKLAVRAGDRLQVLTVAQDFKGREVVDPWWAKQSFKKLEPFVDDKADLGLAFASGMVPTTVLFDKDGKEVWRVVGAMDWDGPRANTLLSEVVG